MIYKGLFACLILGITMMMPAKADDVGDLLVPPVAVQDKAAASGTGKSITKSQTPKPVVSEKGDKVKDAAVSDSKAKKTEQGKTGQGKTEVTSPSGTKNEENKKTVAAGQHFKSRVNTVDQALEAIKPVSDPAVTALLKEQDSRTIAPLQANDFFIGNVHSGDAIQKVRRIFGTPSKYSQSSHFTNMHYEDTDLDMRFVIRNDTASILKETVGNRKAVRIGVDSVFLAKGADIVMSRNIRLKVPTEVLIRQFGIPTDVLRDADANVYYFVYANPNGHDMLVFALGDRKIERVALMPPRPPYVTGATAPTKNQRLERDFTLMGFDIEKPFQPNKYNMWNSLVKRHGNDFWLYGDYGVEVDRRGIVKKVFLLTNNAYTSRGATLGYHMSTVLALYGWPDKVEIGPDADKSVDAYYYDSPFQKGVSLVFVAKHAEQYVDDVILVSSPIMNLQEPMERYGLK